MELSDQEIELVRRLIQDLGSDCPDLSCDEIRPLAEKLGVWEPEKPLTPEQIKQREEWANSPYGKAMSEMLISANKHMAELVMQENPLLDALLDKKPGKIGSTLRIRLPNDYAVKSE